MPCTFDKEGNLLRFESGGIWFSASHYHEDKGSTSRDFPMGSLQDSVAEYEHRTGHRGTLAKIEAERAKWMASPERARLLAPQETVVTAGVIEPQVATIALEGEPPADTIADPLEPKGQEAPAKKPKKAPAKKKGKK